MFEEVGEAGRVCAGASIVAYRSAPGKSASRPHPRYASAPRVAYRLPLRGALKSTLVVFVPSGVCTARTNAAARPGGLAIRAPPARVRTHGVESVRCHLGEMSGKSLSIQWERRR